MLFVKKKKLIPTANKTNVLLSGILCRQHGSSVRWIDILAQSES